MKNLLETKGLSIRLGGFRLGPLSLDLAGNDYLVLLGPSGCGKTSLLRAIAGINAVEPGVLWLDGLDISLLPPHKRRIGYVDQHIDLFPHMDVAENVAFGLRYVKRPAPDKRAAFNRIFSLLGLCGLAHRSPATLSGGESRRVSLARSLIVNPRILLLDEPLSMLDHNAREEMLEALMAIHRELGTATIHVTHDREEAWRIGGRCAVMQGGMIEQTGAVEELFRKPARGSIARFLGGTNIFPAGFEHDGSRSSAVLDWARFSLDSPAGFDKGFVFIRPETLVPVDESRADALETVILSRVDKGIYSELKVRTRNGVILLVHLSGHEDLAPGATARFVCRVPPHPMGE